MLCEACLDEKDRKQFVKIKYFDKMCRTKKDLCKECQRDYITIKREKKLQKIFYKSTGEFQLTFD